MLLIKYYIGFCKTGSDIEKLHPMTTEPKINKTIYSKKRYALDDQLEIFIFSLLLFILIFDFVCFFASFFLSFFFLYEGICSDKKFCHSNTIVLRSQLTFIEKVNIKPVCIYHYFNCYCPRAKDSPNIIHTGRNILKKCRKYLLFI